MMATDATNRLDASPEVTARQLQDDPNAARPSWLGAAIWMGADFFALLRIFYKSGFRIRPRYVGDALNDFLFSLANSSLKGLEFLFYERSVARVKLADDPVFIVGHWRTGTTMLHELLALDERNRCPNTYECFVPNHFVLTERWLKSWSGFVLPPSRPFDNMAMGWDLPQEDEFALLNLGQPSPYASIAFPNRPPLDWDYLDLENVRPAELRRWQRTLVRFVKQLAYVRAGRVILKSPTHTCRVPALLDVFPRARFVNMVRNPYKVFPSTVRLWKGLYSAHGYQKPTHEGLDEHVLSNFIHMHERLEATRGQIAPEMICDLRYEDLVRDPIEQVRALYEQLDLGDFAPAEPAVRKYLDEHADYRTNRHELPAEQRAEIARRWRPYFERYGYEL